MISSASKTVREAAARGLAPPELLTVTEWADAHRFLSPAASAEHGQYFSSRTPYAREFMDCFSANSPVQYVAWCAGAQVSKTESLNNVVGYMIHHAPAAIMYVQPSDEVARITSRIRLQPMIDESPELARLVGPVKSRDAANTVLHKDFPGGFLRLVGAQSPAGLRSLPIRVLLLDEIDAYPGDVGGEGDPIELAEARTRTYQGRQKVAYTSTPTIEGRSRIVKQFLAGDQSFYHVPCPECGEVQIIKWTDIKFETQHGELVDDSVRWACQECASLVPEWKKTEMLEGGIWIPGIPDRSHFYRSFHLNALYSPYGWFSWPEACRKFIEAKIPGNEGKLRAFVNTVLAETWAEKGEAPEWERLYNRREELTIGEVPEGVSILTMGVDVQKDRVEFEVVGWGENFESWSVDYRAIMGNPEQDAVWDELARVIERGYPMAGTDAMARISKVGVDTQGHWTQSVYSWIRSQPTDQVLAFRGGPDTYPMIAGTPKKVEVNAAGKKLRRGLQLWTIGTGIVKGQVYSWLRAEQPTNPDQTGWPRGWSHFPFYEEEHFKQLCAEVLCVRIKRGAGSKRETGRQWVWEKTRERNERLDCRVYARAALFISGADRWTSEDWSNRADMLASGASPKKKRRRRRPKPDSWMNRNRKD